MVDIPVKLKGIEFPVHELLKRKLDNVKKIMKKEWDAIFLIDGIEGSGKSTLSFLCGYYIADGNFGINNICEGTEDAVEKLKNLPNGSVLVIDEGSLMFSSTEVMRKEQRRLIKILNVIRQKNMCLIIVAPSFFNLNKYVSVERSRFLIHVYTTKSLDRGKFCYFSTKKKRILYAIGKKNYNSYSKPKSDFIGNFTDFKAPFLKEYQKIKDKSMMAQFELRKSEADIIRETKIKLNQRIKELNPSIMQKKRAEWLEITPKTVIEWEKPSISP